MTNSDILAYMKYIGRPLYFKQIANWFPGDSEETELFRRIRLLKECGYVRRLPNGQYEVIR